MNVEYTVKDDFLDRADFEKLKNVMLGNKFPWFFKKDDVAHNKKFNTIKNHFYWTHLFFMPNRGAISPLFDILDPLVKKLEPKVLIRIKANLYSNQGKIIEHEDHTDFPFKHKGAIFSLNTCNGFTTLADSIKIDSVANRLLSFDASILHHSSTCTDAKARWNININYF